MLRINSLIFTLCLIISSGFVIAQNPIVTNEIVVSVKESANADNISNENLGKWYSIYKGMYLYGSKFDFEGCNNFADIEGKLIKCRDKILPDKTNSFKNTVNKVTSKYKDLDFTDDNKNKFLEDLNFIAEGIKGAVD